MLPDGSTLLVKPLVDDGSGVLGHVAVVNKPDGTRIFVTVSNTSDGQNPIPDAQAPLTAEQLVEIATTPGLSAVTP